MNSLTYKQQSYIGILLILISIIGLLNGAFFVKSPLPFIIDCPIHIATCFLIFVHIFREQLFSKKIYIIYFVYFLYVIIQVIHGAFNAYIYWQYKALIYNTLSLLLPFFALLFSKPTTSIGVLRTWKNVLNPKYGIIFLLILGIEVLHFTLGPFYFLFAVFIFLLPRKWQLIIGCLLFLMIVGEHESRSQLLKGLIAALMAIGVYFRKYIPVLLLHFTHCFFYFAAIILIVLGITGVFNIFEPESLEGDKKLETNHVYGEVEMIGESELTADTRSFIYYETLTSAIEHNYVIFGRSPSRGNDTNAFAAVAEELLGDFIERNHNELCHLNIFTWTGIVGVILYSFFYIQSSILALYRSKNIYVKYLSVLVAFHWAYGWVEDINDFNLMNVGLWLVIGICLSPSFRNMSEKEFELWIKSIFSSELITPYHQLKLKEEVNILKHV